MCGAMLHHGFTLAVGATPGVKGGFFGLAHTYPSEMAQTFWTAIFAFSSCVLASVVVSLATKPRPDEELKGLVYALTPKPSDGHLEWYQRPAVFGVAVLGATALLNLVFL
jgi:SSS family solute:Na+ symporter